MITGSLVSTGRKGRGLGVEVSQKIGRSGVKFNSVNFSLKFVILASSVCARAMAGRSKMSADIAQTGRERQSATMLLLPLMYSTVLMYSETNHNCLCCLSLAEVFWDLIAEMIGLWSVKRVIITIIYHDFLPTPRRGSHVKPGKTHPQSRYTP